MTITKAVYGECTGCEQPNVELVDDLCSMCAWNSNDPDNDSRMARYETMNDCMDDEPQEVVNTFADPRQPAAYWNGFTISRNEADCLASMADMTLMADYSGRNMYGDTCLGLMCTGPDAPELVQLGWVMREMYGESDEVGEDLLREMMSDVRTDSLGMGSVVYFPNVAVEG